MLNPFQYNSDDILEQLQEVLKNRYTVGEMVKTPEPLIKINGYGIAFKGSVIEFSGLSKSMKSTFIAMIVAACLNPNGEYEGIWIHPSLRDKKILWFDTEMSKEEVAIFQNSLMRASGVEIKKGNHPENYFCYRLREYDEITRYGIIDTILTNEAAFFKKGEVGLFVVDGIADLLLNANDQDSSKSLVTRFTQWADFHEGVAMTAIHTNKDGRDSTGAVGHFLNKKCSYHIRSEKAFGTSSATISSQLARNGQVFPSFQIQYDGNSIPVAVDSDGLLVGHDDTKRRKPNRKKTTEIRTIKEPEVKEINW